jgi:hypothetical protein
MSQIPALQKAVEPDATRHITGTRANRVEPEKWQASGKPLSGGGGQERTRENPCNALTTDQKVWGSSPYGCGGIVNPQQVLPHAKVTIESKALRKMVA